MRKKTFFCVFISLFLFGCTIPGTYMNTYHEVSNSDKNLKGGQIKSRLIPIEHNSLPARIIKDSHYPYQYRVGPLDVLNVTVWNRYEFSSLGSSNALQNNSQSTEIQINALGEIFFPMAGKIKVSGMTVDEVRKHLVIKLSRYIRNPQITLKVTVFNSQRINVLGEVTSPGIKNLTDRPLTILDAISLSGGVNISTANTKHIYVIRSTSPYNIDIYWLNAKSPSSLLLAEHFNLANNDIIYVPPAGVTSFTRVMNQVLPILQTLWFTRSLVKDGW